MGQKIKVQTLVTDGFYTFYISQGSAATQLRCGGMPSNHGMQQWKNFEKRSLFGKDMDTILWLTFLGHPVYM